MKKILSLLILGIFLISLTSAILETKSFDPNAENYGEIQISEWIGISNKADYRLMDYGSSVIDVWAEGEYKLYKKTHLFQGVFYKDTLERRGDLTDEKFFIWENETTTSYNPIYENQNCYIDYSNSTNGNSICENILISNNTITKDTSHWIEYEKNTQLQISEGKWRLEAKRPNNKKIDFVLEAHNKEFTEWAWFNTTWNFKQLIIINFSDSANLSNHWVNFTYIPPENKTASDMSDLRFINFNEDEEIVWKYTRKSVV